MGSRNTDTMVTKSISPLAKKNIPPKIWRTKLSDPIARQANNQVAETNIKE